MHIHISNNQDIKKINISNLAGQLEKIFRYLDIGFKNISFCLCDNSSISELNRKYLLKSNATDVLAFSLTDAAESGYLGEVVVSVEEAVNRSPDFKQNWQKELLLYIIHGILHLTGYDDSEPAVKKIMDTKQKEVLGILGEKYPLF